MANRPTRGSLTKLPQLPESGRFDLSGVARMMSMQQYAQGQSAGRALPRPDEVFSSQAFGPQAPMIPYPIDMPLQGMDGGPAPRLWQYPPGWNLPTPPRGLESVSFDILKEVANVVDIVRRAIEIHKDETSSIEWSITFKDDEVIDLAKAKGKDYLREEKLAIADFFERPDPIGGYDFGDWVSLIIDEVLVKDALSIYPRKTIGRAKGVLGSDIMALQVLAGETIKPLIDRQGARPQPPMPAYQQFYFGVPRSEFAIVDEDPAALWTTEQLIYKPRTLRRSTVYGFPPTEQAILSAITYMRRQLTTQAYFTEGAMPAMFISVGEGWDVNQMERWENALNTMMAGDAAWKWKIKAIPYGSKIDPIRPPIWAMELDEFLVKVISMTFNVTPQELGFNPGKGGLGGKGFSEEAANVQERKGLRPLLAWLERFFTWIIKTYFHQPQLAFKFIGLQAEDDLKVAEKNKIYLSAGVTTINEVREQQGLDALDQPAAHEPLLSTPQGPMLLSAIDKMTTATVTTAENAAKPPEPPAPSPGMPASPEKSPNGGGNAEVELESGPGSGTGSSESDNGASGILGPAATSTESVGVSSEHSIGESAGGAHKSAEVGASFWEEDFEDGLVKAGWDEAAHPRDERGRFGESGTSWEKGETHGSITLHHLLDSEGSRLHTVHEVHTPKWDGWRVKDADGKEHGFKDEAKAKAYAEAVAKETSPDAFAPKPTAAASLPSVEGSHAVSETSSGVRTGHTDGNIEPPKEAAYWSNAERIGPAEGSNPGGRYRGSDGREYYVKFYSNPDRARSEIAAQRVYRAVGVETPKGVLATIDGHENALVTPWISGVEKFNGDGERLNAALKADPEHAAAMYVASAVTQNWDVVGNGWDNVVKTPDGKLMVVDTGGSFTFRARGGTKEYSPDASEMRTLQDSRRNEYAATAFRGLFADPKFIDAGIRAARDLRDHAAILGRAPGISPSQFREKADSALSQLEAKR